MGGTVIPPGVKIAPVAEHALEQSLKCLRHGLAVSAWNWAERARAELDRLTEGQSEEADNETQITS